MSNYPKELLQYERHAHAVTMAMPELKHAYDTFTGADLFEAIQEVGSKYGLGSFLV